MSLLNTPTVENASGEVKAIYTEIQNAFGMVPNGIQLWSASPLAIRAQWEHIKANLSKDKDTQKLHAMIRYLVSDENSCQYCTGFNGGMLINMFGLSQDELLNLQKDPASANLEENNRALLVFAMKSIKNADGVNAEDINALKELDLTEEDIFEIVHSAAHMGVVNILFKTFKVEHD